MTKKELEIELKYSDKEVKRIRALNNRLIRQNERYKIELREAKRR